MMNVKEEFIGIKNLPWSYFVRYPRTSRSIFRTYQDLFLTNAGRGVAGHVIEIGGELSYAHHKYFPKASSFQVTNIGRDYSVLLDVTHMNLADASQDCFLCVSVLEHIDDFEKAVSEMCRTLKPGGCAIVAVPFAFPIHDEVDFWRFTPQALLNIFKDFHIEHFYVLGGKYSSIAGVLQRPKGSLNLRYLPLKLLGWMVLLMGRWFESSDGFASGYGLIVRKRV